MPLQEGEQLVGVAEHGVGVEGGPGPVRQVVGLEHLVSLDEAVDVAAHRERWDGGHHIVEPELEDG